MEISAIYVKSTNEILYSRRNYEIREAEDKSASISGGYTNPQISVKNSDNVVDIKLNGDVLLELILRMDSLIKNKNAKNFPEGYHGRFKIVKNSNVELYESLIINYESVKEFILKVVRRTANE